MVHVSAPGKLLIAGEWALTEPGNNGIVAAINARVHAQIERSTQTSVTIDDYAIKNLHITFAPTIAAPTGHDEETHFLRKALEVTLSYLDAFDQPLAIRTWGKATTILHEGKAHKLGFGSSAASTVAVVSALLRFYGHDLEEQKTKDVLFKLALLAHYQAQGKKGSGFDVAASTYGGILDYVPVDKNWLNDHIEKQTPIKKLIAEHWPGLSIRSLPIPKDLRLLIGWTGHGASTRLMMEEMLLYKQHHLDEYNHLLKQLATNVSHIIAEWLGEHKEKILAAVRKQEEYLRDLGTQSGVHIETPLLKCLSEITNAHGGAGKLSGAGGGDCGIALCFDPATEATIKQAWKKEGIIVVDAQMEQDGVRDE
ncbi:MAG: phosphomevalonate kinase [Candidatus Aenigmarchaeota archaeon]|nr:phosphomevalonate kinase [Candidatus Aenigmarchaeota archaeon]